MLPAILWAAYATTALAADPNGGAIMASPVSVDLGPLLQAVVGLAAAAVTAGGGYVAYLIRSHLKVAQGSADAQIIDMAVRRAGGLAVSYMQRFAASGLTMDVKDQHVAAAVNHVLSSVPDTLKHAGVTPDAVKRMVTAEVGKLEGVPPASSPAVAAPADPSQPAEPNVTSPPATADKEGAQQP